MKKRLPLLDQLPSILEPTIVNELLVEILTNENSFSDISRHEMAEYILELIEKLSDTYALLNETQSDLILKWIENNFSYSEEQYFDLLCTILTNLSTTKARSFVTEQLKSIKDTKIINMLEEVLAEM